MRLPALREVTCSALSCTLFFPLSRYYAGGVPRLSCHHRKFFDATTLQGSVSVGWHPSVAGDGER